MAVMVLPLPVPPIRFIHKDMFSLDAFLNIILLFSFVVIVYVIYQIK